MQQLNTDEVNFPKLFLMISELKNESNNSYKIFSENYQTIIEGKDNFNAIMAQVDLLERNKIKLTQAFSNEMQSIQLVYNHRHSRIEKLKNTLKNFVDISQSLKKNKHKYLENEMMAESEIYTYKRNIKNIGEKLNKLEIENQKNEEKISQVKTENKLLYSTEYDLIHKILHYEKKLSEMSNMKQKNLIILNQSRSDLERVEINLKEYIGVRDKIVNSNLRRKEILESEISQSCDGSENVTVSTGINKPLPIDINPEIIESLGVCWNELMHNLASIILEKNNQLNINNEKRSEMISYLSKYTGEIKLDIQINELEQPDELIKKLYGMISAANSKNNYYELVEREENARQISDRKQKLRELKRSVYDKLKFSRLMKLKRIFIIQMKDDAKNKKKVKFNIKPEIINSNENYQSTDNKKSHKKRTKSENSEKNNLEVKNFADIIEEREDLFKQISRNIEFSTSFTGDKKKKRYFSNFLI